jgi:hypothetical protein
LSPPDGVYTRVVSDMPADKGLFSLTDVDRMPHILALITSCLVSSKTLSAQTNLPLTLTALTARLDQKTGFVHYKLPALT